ncbi:50S ribosomal protein L10 [Candidatus Dependentiae bacterium]|nr:50S ribosomal protein L10 [Candidatus Dependentiae bacterium]
MNRQQKEAVVADFKEMLSSAEATFLVRYRGLSVADMFSLRTALRGSGGKLKITKARLMKIATQGIDGIEPFKDDFKDQIGLVFALDQPSPVAKQLVEFAKGRDALQIVSGFFESKVLTKEEVEFFASIPSREVLLAQLAGTLQAPVASFASVLNMLVLQLLYALKQVAEQKA